MEQKGLWTTLGYVQMIKSAVGTALVLAWGFGGGSSHCLLAHRCTQLSLQCEDQPRSLSCGHRPVSPGCELTAGWWQAVCLAVPHVTASAGEARTARGVTALHPTRPAQELRTVQCRERLYRHPWGASALGETPSWRLVG